MPERNALGSFSPVIYYESPSGKLSLPMASDECHRGHNGWIRKEARNFDQLDDLQRRLEDQDKKELHGQLERDQIVFESKRQKTRDSLLKTLTSSNTSPYEKEFIREYLSISDKRKRRFYQKHKSINSYFMAREYDDMGEKLIQE